MLFTFKPIPFVNFGHLRPSRLLFLPQVVIAGIIRKRSFLRHLLPLTSITCKSTGFHYMAVATVGLFDRNGLNLTAWYERSFKPNHD